MAFGLATEDDDAQSLTQKNNEVLSDTQHSALLQAIENRKISDEDVTKILNKYSYSNTKEIKIKDFGKICNEFKNLVKEQ